MFIKNNRPAIKNNQACKRVKSDKNDENSHGSTDINNISDSGNTILEDVRYIPSDITNHLLLNEFWYAHFYRFNNT